MTDLTLRRGDSRNYQMSIVDAVPAAVDITGAIAKFAIKSNLADTNAEAVVLKTSYDAGEILFSNPTGGVLLVQLLKDDTFDAGVAKYCWDLELTRQGALVTSAGSVELTNGSKIIVGSIAVDFSNVKVGDVFLPSGGSAPNQKPVTISDVGGSGRATDPGPGNLLTDYPSFATESGVSFVVNRGNVKTPTGLSGSFTLTGDAAL